MRVLLDAFRQMQWQDVVDIAILTGVLFKTYTWLRGTVAFQVALGMITLVVAAFAAGELGLVLTGYVLKAVGAVAVLVAVVIFRDEIRRGLGRASPLRWWRERRAPSAPASDVGPLADGLFALAKKRIGALVVMPRSDSLAEHLTGGTELDALVSPQLLEALFHHGSPVHDGALVVEGKRAKRVGAFLPLSTSLDLPESYGTRHRAAVGLTEACDAVTIVVSEQRGEVSVASQGRIAPLGTPVALSRRIAELKRPDGGRREARRAASDAPGGRLRGVVVRLAFVVGVLAAWYALAGQRGSIITRDVPIELTGAPAGLMFEPPQPGQVTVQLRGSRRLLLSMAPADVRAAIDLSGASPGHHDIAVATIAPRSVEIVRVVPPRVSLEVLERRVVPVTALLDVGFPRGLRVREIVPPEVTVVGRTGALRGVDSIRTRPVPPGAVVGGVARAQLQLRDGVSLADERQREVVVLFENSR